MRILLSILSVFWMFSCASSKKWLEFEPHLKILENPPEHWGPDELWDKPTFIRNYALCACFYRTLELIDRDLERRMIKVDYSRSIMWMGLVDNWLLIDSLALKEAKLIIDAANNQEEGQTHQGCGGEDHRPAILLSCLAFSRSKPINDMVQKEIDRIIKSRREANRGLLTKRYLCTLAPIINKQK